jgi:hypothetical protein
MGGLSLFSRLLFAGERAEILARTFRNTNDNKRK